MEHFDLLYSVKANDAIPVFKYKSKRTGLTICIAQVEGPLVNGYFCLATEAHDDDGLPHTLEHLVFMGSEKYPYKGVLDLLANRCLASGTNAWTDTDHTCYTMTTAGSDGFLTLMPIYLDHILYPTLTDSAYITEVHHVNGEGEDSGVVYCEMQGCENTGENLSHLHMLRGMYPGHCGYKSETGGIMKNLRTSTSNIKVRDYHKTFYRAENLCLVITGQVEPKNVFEALQDFEDKILSKDKLPPYKRPWQDNVKPLPESKKITISYPSDDEQFGLYYHSWRGPKSKNQYSVSSIMVLMEYLTDSPISPFQRDFVEIDEPYCSNVRYSIIENSETCLYMKFQNVPKEKLKDLHERVDNLLQKIGNKQEVIDMKRMASVIHRRILETLNNIEDQPHDTFAFVCIGDSLYGNNPDDFAQRLNTIKMFKKMKGEPQDYWHNLIKTYYMDKQCVQVIGDPSQKCQTEMSATEKTRVEEQCKTLGSVGLEKNTNSLEQAKKDNEKEPPSEVLTSVKVPDVASIKFHPIKISNNQGKANKLQGFPLDDMLVTFRVDDIHSNFVQMNVILETSMVPADLKPLLPLYCEVLFESPILRDGNLVSYEQIIAELEEDTLYTHSALGIGGGKFNCGKFSQLLQITLKVEIDKYKKGVAWLRELLFQTVFTAERLKIVASKMANDVATMKRNGNKVVRSVVKDITFNKESNHYITNMMRQHKFLTQLLNDLKSDEKVKKVVEQMKALQALLTHPDNIVVQLAADVQQLARSIPDPNKVWKTEFLPDNKKAANIGTPPLNKASSQFLLPMTEGQRTGVIVGVGSVESSYLLQTTPGITNYEDPDLPALLVFIQYLTQLEGPMWRQLRGLGLTYHYSISVNEEWGLLSFLLFKSTHIVNAYKQAKIIVEGYIDGTTPFNDVELETSKSSLVFEIIERETTVGNVAVQSLLSYYKGVGIDYNRSLLDKVFKVSLSDLKKVGEKYLRPLFNTSLSRCTICCNPSKVDEIAQGFKGLSRDLEILKSLEEGFLVEQ